MLPFAQHGLGIGHHRGVLQQRLALVPLAQQVGGKGQSQCHFAAAHGAGEHQGVGHAPLLDKLQQPVRSLLLSYYFAELHGMSCWAMATTLSTADTV